MAAASPPEPFTERLHARMRSLGTRVCLGIDPRPEAHETTHPQRHDGDPARIGRAVAEHAREVMRASEDLIACVKPQAAFFEALGIPGLIALAQVIADARALSLPVILDAKRGDIGTTAEAYARAYLSDGVFGSDALTVNPWLGLDTLEPFLTAATAAGRGVFALVKTSNPGSGDLQDLPLAAGGVVHEALAGALAARATALAPDRDGFTPLGAVVGATYPAALTALRARMPQALLLVPGYGAQGAEAGDVLGAFREDGLGAVVNASRSIFYASAVADGGAAARAAALAMRDAIERALGERAAQGSRGGVAR